MNDSRLAPALEVIEAAIERGDIPGAVSLVRWKGDIVLHCSRGWASLEPTERPMTCDTVFDLASLTKPLVTATTVLALTEQRLLELDRPAAVYLRELGGSAHEHVTIRQLLTHNSGLPGWYPTYTATRVRGEVPRVIAGLAPSWPPGTRVEYSCLNYILLGFIVERITGRSLDAFAAGLIFRPIGLRDTGYRPRFTVDRYASTERGNVYEQRMVADLGLTFDHWRRDFYPGAVNDGNTHYALGGVSGNAGLFGTADDAGVLGQMWLNGGEYEGTRILSRRTVEEATRDGTPALNEARSLAWQINVRRPGAAAPLSSGERLSGRAFGHTGFTGTSLWVDPERELVAVLLTNRTHPVAGDRDVITAIRGDFHDAVSIAVAAGHDSGYVAQHV